VWNGTSPGGFAPDRRVWTRDFRLYFTARAVAMLGDSMLPIALSAGLLQHGYRAGDIGYALASYTACFAGFVVFGGVFADRLSARGLMIGADLVRVCTQSLASLLFFTGHVVLWQVCAIGAVNGVAAAMFQPGVASTVPRVARDVQGANGRIRTAEAMMALTGPALAGALVGFASAGGVFAVHAATYAISATCLLLLRLPPAPADERRRTGGASTFRADLVEGWREFTARTWMWSVIVIWMIYTILVVGPTTPLAAGQILPAHGAGAYGLVNSALGAGTALGGLSALRIRPARPLRAGACAILCVACYPAAVGAALPLPWIALGAFVSGTGSAFWGVMWATSVQTQVPGEILNRIHAYEVAGSVAMVPVGQALAGPESTAFGARPVLLTAALAVLGVSAALLSVRSIRTLGRGDRPPTA
jgi:hypothetical protein